MLRNTCNAVAGLAPAPGLTATCCVTNPTSAKHTILCDWPGGRHHGCRGLLHGRVRSRGAGGPAAAGLRCALQAGVLVTQCNRMYCLKLAVPLACTCPAGQFVRARTTCTWNTCVKAGIAECMLPYLLQCLAISSILGVNATCGDNGSSSQRRQRRSPCRRAGRCQACRTASVSMPCWSGMLPCK